MEIAGYRRLENSLALLDILFARRIGYQNSNARFLTKSGGLLGNCLASAVTHAGPVDSSLLRCVCNPGRAPFNRPTMNPKLEVITIRLT